MSELQPSFRATSYAEQARRFVRELILGGRYEPGERLNELEISQALGISRSPVREAIHSLASEGLVTVIPQKGAFVTEFSPERIRELYEVREALEVMAARLACERAEASHLDHLRQILRDTRAEVEKGGDMSHPWDHASYPWNMDFHQEISRLGRNEKLAEEIAKIDQQLRLARSRSASKPGRAELAYEEHARVFEAIRARDVTRAENEMRAHLRNALKSFEEVFLGSEAGET